MPCPLCGDICRCSIDGDSAVAPRWLADDKACLPPEGLQGGLQAPVAEAPSLPLSAEAPTSSNSVEPAVEEDSYAWRQEVAARLNRYQTRRKPRPPRYPSLRLRFEEQDSTHNASAAPDDSAVFPQSMDPASHHALALNSFADSAGSAVEAPASGGRQAEAQSGRPNPRFGSADESSQQPIITTTAKIIEFPRSWTPPPPALDELAESVTDSPRILEAPEVAPPPPALGGITIESALQPELEKRPGIDIPLHSAPLSRRIFSAAVDAVIIASAGGLFGFIFWKMTAIQPPLFQIVGFNAALAGLFWAGYQYLLIVYSGSTPGLRLAKLEVARFDGTPAPRRLRRWRVLASFLSAVSLGMGYAWVFLDEDALCWHDRITHTYLAPKKREQR